MPPQRIQPRQQSSSQSGPGGWFLRRLPLIREFLALAKQNGATKDLYSPDTDDDMSTNKNDKLTQEHKLAALAEQFPTSTTMERLRFLRACKGKIEGTFVKLQAYIDWRELHGLDTPEYQESKLASTSDEQDWQESCSMAVAYAEKMGLIGANAKKKGNRSPKASKSKKLPQIVFVHTDENGEPQKSLAGNLILHAMPGRLDKQIAPAEIYALVLGLYLDRKQNRESVDLFSVMLDVRGGKGWANPPAYNMMPFIKSAATLLHQHFPERLDKLIVYPLPRTALWIWQMVKPFLDVSAVSSAYLIGGKDTSASPPPNDKLKEFVDLSILEHMEKHRLSTCTQPTTKSSTKKSSSGRFGGKL